jgi:hypothetical protein
VMAWSKPKPVERDAERQRSGPPDAGADYSQCHRIPPRFGHPLSDPRT